MSGIDPEGLRATARAARDRSRSLRHAAEFRGFTPPRAADELWHAAGQLEYLADRIEDARAARRSTTRLDLVASAYQHAARTRLVQPRPLPAHRPHPL